MSGKQRLDRPAYILLQDVVLSMLASLLSVLAIRLVSEPIPGFIFLVLKWLGVSLASSLLGFFATGCYKAILRYATVRSIAKVVAAVLIKVAILSVALIFGFIKFKSSALCVVSLLLDLILTAGFLLWIRMAARLFASDSQDIRTKASSRNALVEGTGPAAVALARQLQKEGYNVLGFLTKDKSAAGRVVADFIVYAWSDQKDFEQLQWRLGGIDGVFFPKSEDRTPEVQAEDDEIIPDVDGMTQVGHMLKRSFDCFFSGLLLILFSPLMALCAILVKMEDGGPVIFAQERIGRNGKPFFIYKFRSMRIDAEASGQPALYSGEDDPRLTKTGRFLRAHHLDELPQLWNVFKGDMSFIGYRPERRYYIDRIMACNARYRYLYQIRPGVTSYATLYNGYTDTLDKMLTRLDLDLYYLRNHSLLFDAKVLGLTFISIVSGKKF